MKWNRNLGLLYLLCSVHHPVSYVKRTTCGMSAIINSHSNTLPSGKNKDCLGRLQRLSNVTGVTVTVLR